ncbi:MAG: YgfZ/GcvT domain-containing protein [Opitutales bacterium]
MRVSGEDAGDFLQSQFTNELRPIEAGRCVYGLWLNVKGKVMGDGFVLCEGKEKFRIISGFSDADTISDQLERHIIADDVGIERFDGAPAMALAGDQVELLLENIGATVPQAGYFTDCEGIIVFRGRWSRSASVELIFPSEEVRNEWRGRVEEAGVSFVDEACMHFERMEAGYPWVPIEIGPEDLPAEGGLEESAIAFEKGCFLGQEAVARMRNLGRPQRALFVVSGQGPVPHCPASLQTGEERKAGELRAAWTDGCNWKGTALLKLRHAETGSRLWRDGEEIEVRRLMPGLKREASNG